MTPYNNQTRSSSQSRRSRQDQRSDPANMICKTILENVRKRRRSTPISGYGFEKHLLLHPWRPDGDLRILPIIATEMDVCLSPEIPDTSGRVFVNTEKRLIDGIGPNSDEIRGYISGQTIPYHRCINPQIQCLFLYVFLVSPGTCLLPAILPVSGFGQLLLVRHSNET